MCVLCFWISVLCFLYFPVFGVVSLVFWVGKRALLPLQIFNLFWVNESALHGFGDACA